MEDIVTGRPGQCRAVMTATAVAAEHSHAVWFRESQHAIFDVHMTKTSLVAYDLMFTGRVTKA